VGSSCYSSSSQLWKPIYNLLGPLTFNTMRRQLIWLQFLATLAARAQQTTDASSTGTESTASSTSNTQSSSKASGFTFTNSFSTIETTIAETQFTDSQYTYATDDGQSTVTLTGTSSPSSEQSTGASTTQSSHTTHQKNATDIIAGSSHTGTTTSTASVASNTVPCNNYPEFCNRKYSNITEVCAHNSAFSIKNNAASNQELGIVDQLNDGVRMSK
jgi:hypothetical protein